MLHFAIWRGTPMMLRGLILTIRPLTIVWPLIALVAFLAWKWTWPRFVRWRGRRLAATH